MLSEPSNEDIFKLKFVEYLAVSVENFSINKFA